MAEPFRFQAALEALQSELKQAVSQHAELENKIASLRQSVAGLLRLKDASFDEDEPQPDHMLSHNPYFQMASDMGTVIESMAEVFGGTTPKLTQVCRSVVQSANQPLTAGEVRRELEIMGFDFSRYISNPLSAIHTTLKRDRTIRSFKRVSDDKTVYECLRSAPSPNSLAASLAKNLTEHKDRK